MTSPSPLPLPPADLEFPPGAEHSGLLRVTVLVGGLRLDVGLPGDIEIAGYIGDLLDIASGELSARGAGDTRFDVAADQWSLAPLGGALIDPEHSLASADVYDGDVLVVRGTSTVSAPMLFDDVGPDGSSPAALRWLSTHRTPLSAFGIAFAAAVVWVCLLPRLGLGPGAAAVTLGVGLMFVAAGCVASRRTDAQVPSIALPLIAIPLLFIGSLCIVPNSFAVPALPMAFAVIALAAQLALQICRTGHVFHSFVIALAALGGLISVVANVWHPQPRVLGAAVATVAVVAFYLAPRVTILLARLPLPRVPTAGEPLDDIETHGGITVEGVGAVGLQTIPTEEHLLERVRLANDYLTGILISAGLTAAFGCYLALDTADGFSWQSTAFAVAVATALCLRGRTHHDLVQSATLIASGLGIAVLLIVKTAAHVPNWQIQSGFAAMALALLSVLCGIVAPRLEFSPVMRRWVELLEYLAIAMVFPLCFWIVGLYSYVRELRL
ncbi:type VII secretion integral membrane protein EccD [Mycolicibacterium brisbanense]